MMEVDDTSLIRTLLRKGLGFSVLSQGALQNEKDRQRARGAADPPAHVVAARHDDGLRPAALRAARGADERDPRDGARADREW